MKEKLLERQAKLKLKILLGNVDIIQELLWEMLVGMMILLLRKLLVIIISRGKKKLKLKIRKNMFIMRMLGHLKLLLKIIIEK